MRGVFGNNNDVNPLKTGMNLGRKTNLEDVPTDVLRNLWLVRFGGRAVTMGDMHNHRFDDIADVGQELANRNQVRLETLLRPDIMVKENYYVLENEDADN
jgi:hypothetical protein